MPKSVFPQKVALTIAFSLAPALAQAHPGHDSSSFAGGLVPPRARHGSSARDDRGGALGDATRCRARWVVPATFVSVMLAGGALGASGFPMPFVEQGILASVFILGLLIAMAARLPIAASSGLIAVFALFHGVAHGAEMPANASGLAYGAGFALRPPPSTCAASRVAPPPERGPGLVGARSRRFGADGRALPRPELAARPGTCHGSHLAHLREITASDPLARPLGI